MLLFPPTLVITTTAHVSGGGIMFDSSSSSGGFKFIGYIGSSWGPLTAERSIAMDIRQLGVQILIVTLIAAAAYAAFKEKDARCAPQKPSPEQHAPPTEPTPHLKSKAKSRITEIIRHPTIVYLAAALLLLNPIIIASQIENNQGDKLVNWIVVGIYAGFALAFCWKPFILRWLAAPYFIFLAIFSFIAIGNMRDFTILRLWWPCFFLYIGFKLFVLRASNKMD